MNGVQLTRDQLLDQDEDDLYDEVDEDTYEQHRRDHLQYSDFIVDDGDGDYGGDFDDGRDIMEDDDEAFNAQYSKAGKKGVPPPSPLFFVRALCLWKEGFFY